MTAIPTAPIMPDSTLLENPPMSPEMIKFINELIIDKFDYDTRIARFSIFDLNAKIIKHEDRLPPNSQSFRNLLVRTYALKRPLRGWIIKFTTKRDIYQNLGDMFTFIAPEE